jgi:hypothetical protein
MQYEWATDEWFAEVVRSGDRLAPTPGADLLSQYVITETPKGTIRYVEEIEDGKIKRVFLGERQGADLKLTMTYADYRKMLTQFLSANQLPTCKIEGDVKKLQPLAPVRSTEQFKTHRAHMVEVTRWPGAPEET